MEPEPLTVTDARGATQTYSYNDRHLPTGISYSDLTSVSIAYDGAGNRTLMTDGTGSRTYQYNQLSQLTSETRQFAGLAGNFTLSYEYNLAGALKAFTDHAGSRVDYAFNNAGYVVETNVDRKYRTYWYGNPQWADCAEAKQIVAIKNILLEEFRLGSLQKPVP